jgi:hypothetical protein
MSNLRSGIYGDYFGSYWGESAPLTSAQMEVSAFYVYSALTDAGWTPEAISGLLGNLQHESGINPGRWEGDSVGSGPGYSLVQWTPYTNYTDWCAAEGRSDPSEMDNAIARILYELENGLQYYETDAYPLSFREFTQDTGSPYDLACAFAWNYERSWTVLYGTEEEKEALRQLRGGAAESWYTYLTGKEPTPPGSGGSKTKRRKKYNFVLFGRKAWRTTI